MNRLQDRFNLESNSGLLVMLENFCEGFRVQVQIVWGVVNDMNQRQRLGYSKTICVGCFNKISTLGQNLDADVGRGLGLVASWM